MRTSVKVPAFAFEQLDTDSVTQATEGDPGFAVITGVPVDHDDLDGMQHQALQLATKFAHHCPRDAGGRLTWLVKNEGIRLFESDENLTKYKSSKSADALPFHTDGSAQWLGQSIDWMMLLAVVSDQSGGTTALVDARDVFVELSNKYPRLVARLCDPVPFDRVYWGPRRAADHYLASDVRVRGRTSARPAEFHTSTRNRDRAWS